MDLLHFSIARYLREAQSSLITDPKREYANTN